MGATRLSAAQVLFDMEDNERLIARGPSKIGPSPVIWHDCPLLSMMLNPSVGFYYQDDFTSWGVAVGVDATAAAAGWTVTVYDGSTKGEFGTILGAGGELHLANIGNTADQGVNVQLLNCCVKPEAGKTIWFETRVQISHVDNQIFVGIAETNTTIISSGALDEAGSDASMIGFFTDINSTTGKGGVISEKNGSNDTNEDTIAMAATTWYTLGFRIEGVSKIEFYQDGKIVSVIGDAADIPDGIELALSLVCQNEDGTNANTLKIDWIRIAQLR